MQGYKNIITIEEHSEVNGFYSFISSLIFKYNIKNINLKYLALPHDHCSVVGDQKYLCNALGLSTDNLLSMIG